MRSRYFFTFLILVSIITGVLGQDQTGSSDLTVEQFKAKIAETPDAIILDVRTPDEVKNGKIPNAQVIDFFGNHFDAKIKALDKNKTYFIYCAAGGRSSETLELMSKEGFKKLYNLKGGFTAWKSKNMPIQH